MTARKLRVGLAGAGSIGAVHARNVANSPNMSLVTIYDPVSTRAAPLAETYSARFADDLATLVGAHDVDAVIVASPTDTHFDVVLAAAAAGKAIYCEKPIDLDITRARRAAAAVRAAGVPLMIGFNRRFEPSYAALRYALVTGDLGRLQVVQITSRGPQNAPSPEYIRSSGGIFRDKCVHFFDLLRFIAVDEPVELSVMGASLSDPFIGKLGDHDTVVASVRLRGGALCVIDCSRRASYGYDERIEVFGTKGMMESPRLPRSPNARTSGLEMATARFPQNLMERAGSSYALSIEAFARMVIEGDRGGVPTLEDGLIAQAMAEAAMISAQERRSVVVAECI